MLLVKIFTNLSRKKILKEKNREIQKNETMSLKEKLS